MRQYIRHPSDMPIQYKVTTSEQADSDHQEKLSDVSSGGLSFFTSQQISPGNIVHVKIEVEPPPFDAEGIVVWCKKLDDGYQVGLRFNDSDVEFAMRMKEQICHIEHYRKEIKLNEGRDISSEQAATEWIAKYAAQFPR